MSLQINDSDRILVVAPHPDDESIGCGGFLSLYHECCDVLLVTDGYREEKKNKEISKIRVQEFIEAMEYLGIDNRYFLHIQEQCIRENFKRFLEIDYSKYRYIFVPNRYEIHKDHADVYFAIKKTIKQKKCKAEIIEYEVWTTLRFPNVKIDISSVLEKKKEVILKHKSQINDLDYVGMIIGLNAYRGKGHGCDYAEMFYSETRARKKYKKERKQKIKSIIERNKRKK